MQIEVTLRPVADLAPYSRNARKHNAAAIARLVAIIEEMGWTNPILVDEDGIVAGHKRRLRRAGSLVGAWRRDLSAGRRRSGSLLACQKSGSSSSPINHSHGQPVDVMDIGD